MKLKPRHGAEASLKRLRSRRRPRFRLPAEACRRHGAADAFKAGQHDRALRRTGRGAPELDLKRCRHRAPVDHELLLRGRPSYTRLFELERVSGSLVTRRWSKGEFELSVPP